MQHALSQLALQHDVARLISCMHLHQNQCARLHYMQTRFPLLAHALAACIAHRQAVYIPGSLQGLQQPVLAQVLLLADKYSAPKVADNAVLVLVAMAGGSSRFAASGSRQLDASVVREFVQVSPNSMFSAAL